MRSAMIVGLLATTWMVATTAMAQSTRSSHGRAQRAEALAPRAGSPSQRTSAVTQANYSPNPIARWAAAQIPDSATGASTVAPSSPPREAASMPADQAAAMPADVEFVEPGMDYMPHSNSAMPIDGGCADCGPDWTCDSCGPPLLRPWATWNAGFAFTFLQPRYSDNLAATVLDTTDTSATISETSFDYDVEVSPRVWLQWGMGDNFGWRAQWWQLDQSANQVEFNAPASGLGNVAPVPFPDIDISVSAPGESLRADSQLKMYAVDLEGMRWVDFGCWSLMTAGGFRFASIDNDYRAEATNAAGAVSGTVRHSRSLDGFGPTFLIEARRPLTYRMTMFSNVRASLLFGESDTTTTAGEDLDLASAFTTERTTHTDDLLPILEAQWGVDWRRPVTRCHDFFLSAAVEGQWWSGVGTASNGDSDLGLFGFVLGLGLEY